MAPPRRSRLNDKDDNPTRRIVLLSGALLAAGVAFCGGQVYSRWWARKPGDGLKALSQEEYDIVQKMGDAWMPAGDERPILSGSEANVGAFVDEVVATMPKQDRNLLKLLIEVLDDVVYPMEGKQLHELEPYEIAVHLRVWLASPIFLHRQGVTALIALIALGYTNHPEVSPTFETWFGCGYGQ